MNIKEIISPEAKRTLAKGTVGFLGGVATGACVRLAYETMGGPDRDSQDTHYEITGIVSDAVSSFAGVCFFGGSKQILSKLGCLKEQTNPTETIESTDSKTTRSYKVKIIDGGALSSGLNYKTSQKSMCAAALTSYVFTVVSAVIGITVGSAFRALYES